METIMFRGLSITALEKLIADAKENKVDLSAPIRFKMNDELLEINDIATYTVRSDRTGKVVGSFLEIEFVKPTFVMHDILS